MASEEDARREYLRGLREKALERVLEEERAVGIVSRRASLVGLAAVAAAAGARPLRALADGPAAAMGALRERAAMAGGMRIPAPQYGAPGLPEPRVPFEPAGTEAIRSSGKVFDATTREDLAAPQHWLEDYAVLIPADGNAAYGWSPGDVKTWVIAYDVPRGEKQALQAISHPQTGMIYIVPGGHDFYVEDDGELWGFLFTGHFLTIRRSYFRMKGDAEAVGEAIRGFVAKVSDATLRKEERDAPGIDIGTGVTRGGGWGFILGVSAKNGVASVQLNTGGAGTHLRIDWKKQKLVD